jgi:hypothetical protein
MRAKASFETDTQAQIRPAVARVEQPRGAHTASFAAAGEYILPRKISVFGKLTGAPEIERMDRQQVSVIRQIEP